MYSTISDLQLHFSSAFLLLTADDDNSGSWDTGVLNQAITDADQRLDALLGVAYVTPFADPVPDLIKELSSILAGENLARRVPSGATIVDHGDFRRADALITALAEGKVLLAGAERRTRLISSEPPAEDRIFTADTLGCF